MIDPEDNGSELTTIEKIGFIIICLFGIFSVGYICVLLFLNVK